MPYTWTISYPALAVLVPQHIEVEVVMILVFLLPVVVIDNLCIRAKLHGSDHAGAQVDCASVRYRYLHFKYYRPGSVNRCKLALFVPDRLCREERGDNSFSVNF